VAARHSAMGEVVRRAHGRESPPNSLSSRSDFVLHLIFPRSGFGRNRQLRPHAVAGCKSCRRSSRWIGSAPIGSRVPELWNARWIAWNPAEIENRSTPAAGVIHQRLQLNEPRAEVSHLPDLPSAQVRHQSPRAVPPSRHENSLLVWRISGANAYRRSRN